MNHCILPCKFNHLWPSPSGPSWPYSTGRLWSGPITIYEAGLRLYPRHKFQIKCGDLFHSSILYLIWSEDLIVSHFMLFLRKMRKRADLNSTPCRVRISWLKFNYRDIAKQARNQGQASNGIHKRNMQTNQ